MLPAFDVPVHRQKQLLQHFEGVRILQARSPQDTVNHWLIERYELHPSVVILGIAKPQQQTRTGCRRERHSRFLTSYTLEIRQPYTKIAGRVLFRHFIEFDQIPIDRS